MTPISRRALLAAATGAAGLALARVSLAEGPGAVPASLPEPVSRQVAPGLRLHMIQTGWVAVKRSHRAFGGPAALRLPAILADSRWTEWMPVTAWVIETPDEVIVVDTGETARITEPDYAACDPVTGFIYGANLQFGQRPEDEIGPQMQRLGLDPGLVRRVVQTHLHSDHIGGLGHFAHAEMLVGPEAVRGHQGALMCHLPVGMRVQPAQYTDGDYAAFGAGQTLDAGGRVAIVPTPGHANGHQSVRVRGDGRTWLIAGDAAFDVEQIARGTMAGIVEDAGAARRTLAVLKTLLDEGETVILPSHDAGNRARLTTP